MSGEEPRELEQEQEAQGQGDDLEATGGIEPDAESVTAEPEAEQAAPSQIDLNTATEEELRQLPGIGAALASRIVSYRLEAGPFSSPEGITAVSGVAGATYDGLAERLTVGPAEPQAEEGGDLVEPEPAPVEVEADEPEGVPVIVSESAAAEEEPAELEDGIGDVDRPVPIGVAAQKEFLAGVAHAIAVRVVLRWVGDRGANVDVVEDSISVGIDAENGLTLPGAHPAGHVVHGAETLRAEKRGSHGPSPSTSADDDDVAFG